MASIKPGTHPLRRQLSIPGGRLSMKLLTRSRVWLENGSIRLFLLMRTYSRIVPTCKTANLSITVWTHERCALCDYILFACGVHRPPKGTLTKLPGQPFLQVAHRTELQVEDAGFVTLMPVQSLHPQFSAIPQVSHAMLNCSTHSLCRQGQQHIQ